MRLFMFESFTQKLKKGGLSLPYSEKNRFIRKQCATSPHASDSLYIKFKIGFLPGDNLTWIDGTNLICTSQVKGNQASGVLQLGFTNFPQYFYYSSYQCNNFISEKVTHYSFVKY